LFAQTGTAPIAGEQRREMGRPKWLT
jgi:hypothetical protein